MGIRSFETRRPSIALVRVEGPCRGSPGPPGTRRLCEAPRDAAASVDHGQGCHRCRRCTTPSAFCRDGVAAALARRGGAGCGGDSSPGFCGRSSSQNGPMSEVRAGRRHGEA